MLPARRHAQRAGICCTSKYLSSHLAVLVLRPVHKMCLQDLQTSGAFLKDSLLRIKSSDACRICLTNGSFLKYSLLRIKSSDACLTDGAFLKHTLLHIKLSDSCRIFPGPMAWHCTARKRGGAC